VETPRLEILDLVIKKKKKKKNKRRETVQNAPESNRESAKDA
jgi:hypothetical protein